MAQGIFTLLYNESYLAGALVLGIEIRKILERQPETDISLGVIIDKERINEYQVSLLQNFYDDIIEVKQLASELDDILTNDLGRPELKQTFTKIQLWSLTRYDKILYLDADTLPNVPKDKSQGSILDLLKLEFPANKILAAPDSGFPDIFNSGVMLLKPNKSDYTNLLNLIEESKTNRKVSFDGADQGLLNQYFNLQPDWVQDLVSSHQIDVAVVNNAKSSNWIPLPFLYNVTPSTEYEYLPAYKHFAAKGWLSTTYGSLGTEYSKLLPYFNGANSQIKLVHFIGPVKPWKAELPIGIYGQWWDVWRGYFGNVTVEEVVYHGGGDLGGEYSTGEGTYHDDCNLASESSTNEEREKKIAKALTLESQQNDQFVPSYLCDPSNYQHIPSNIASSADASWDPAKEPPPAAQTIKNETVELERGMRSFTNAWDSTDHDEGLRSEGTQSIAENQQPSAELPTIEPTQKSTNEHPTNEHQQDDPQAKPFGYHVSQKPERVFADENLVLAHAYMPRTTSNDPDLISSPEHPVPGQLEHDEIYKSLANLQLQLDQENLANREQNLIQPEHEDKQENPLPEVNPITKLFPWEFKETKYAPERSFD
ncbi:uncharacterized protein AC631_01725 [Debaryomyces fabryi]|uniref:Glycogenin-2 n=1 Tax=Debaryomyces fabryi TaxID=58627 RepID=A0A0V1Q2E7_9ASCO|nr:uncharacterized protein AC631_01725 [Debaryomyces fabryi]KSA02550.1 hypothetical protein AC631_01725 [Debaryomyces fabryi]CUM47690.1 unnamed protein product [Debaryomyces fabryi]